MAKQRPTATIERKLATLLPLAFGLTVVSFCSATIIAELRTRRIEDDAHAIVTLVVPTIDHVSRARTELRHVQVLLESYPDATDLEADLARARVALDREWQGYVSFPPRPGSAADRAEIVRQRAELDAVVDRFAHALRRGDKQAALTAVDDARPMIYRFDDALRGAVERNASNAARLGGKISRSAASGRATAFGLDGLSLLLAIIAGYVVIRVTRHYLDTLGTRMSDLELFAGRVAHDIRSPLTSVSLAVGLAKRRDAQDDKTQAMLDRAGLTLQRVGQLVDGLLVFARSGASPAHAAHAEAKEVVEAVTDELTPAAKEKDIEVQLERVDPCAVACSPGVLASVVTNLVANAIKYMGQAPRRQVTLRVLDLGATARIEVEDTGPGIPEQSRDHIFDPHVRAAEASVPGLGLGLATVRRLVEGHGGTVGVRSAEAGSLFWLELPKARRTA